MRLAARNEPPDFLRFMGFPALFLFARWVRRAGRPGSTAGRMPATTVAGSTLNQCHRQAAEFFDIGQSEAEPVFVHLLKGDVDEYQVAGVERWIFLMPSQTKNPTFKLKEQTA